MVAPGSAKVHALTIPHLARVRHRRYTGAATRCAATICPFTEFAMFKFMTTLVLTLGAGIALAAPLAVGDPAPPFELAGSDGNTHRLADYAGRTVALAWFPKAFTGG